MEENIDNKDEEKLELCWGWWLADSDFQKWRVETKDGKYKKEETTQFELFEEKNNC